MLFLAAPVLTLTIQRRLIYFCFWKPIYLIISLHLRLSLKSFAFVKRLGKRRGPLSTYSFLEEISNLWWLHFLKSGKTVVNPFQATALFLFSLKTSKNPLVFLPRCVAGSPPGVYWRSLFAVHTPSHHSTNHVNKETCTLRVSGNFSHYLSLGAHREPKLAGCEIIE